MRGSIAGLWGVVLLWGVLSTACRMTSADAPYKTQEKLVVYTALLEKEAKSYLASFRGYLEKRVEACKEVKATRDETCQEVNPYSDIELVRLGTTDLVERLLQERYNPQADVIWGLTATNLVLLEWKDMLVPYKPHDLARVPQQFRHASTPPYWVGIFAWTLAVCVNTATFEEHNWSPPPTTWEDLKDPKYRGQLVMPHPPTSSLGYTIVDAILQAKRTTKAGESPGWQELGALHQNVRAYVGSSQTCEQVRDGKAAIGVTYDLTALKEEEQARKTGKPIKVIFLTSRASDGSEARSEEQIIGWDMPATALIKKSSLTVKPEAKLFLDWAISEKAMTAYGTNTSLTAVPLKSPEASSKLPADQKKLFNRDIMRSAAQRDRIIEEWKLHCTQEWSKKGWHQSSKDEAEREPPSCEIQSEEKASAGAGHTPGAPVTSMK
jgi:iron(III) transport system substrate-binding protein